MAAKQKKFRENNEKKLSSIGKMLAGFKDYVTKRNKIKKTAPEKQIFSAELTAEHPGFLKNCPNMKKKRVQTLKKNIRK